MSNEFHQAMEDLWQWQLTLTDRDLFLQVRECFCQAAAVLWDPEGTILFRAAELMKASGEREQAQELYEQLLPRVLHSGSPGALARGYYWAGAVRGFRALHSREPEEGAMADALRLFEQALALTERCSGSDAPSRTPILWAIVTCHGYLGETEQVQQRCQEILDLQKSLPAQHPDRIETCIQFSQLCRKYGSRSDSQQWLLKAAALLEQAVPGEDMGWMYGVVACNGQSLPAEKRLWLLQQEKEHRPRHFRLDLRDLSRWHSQVAGMYERMGRRAEAAAHREQLEKTGHPTSMR